MLTYYQADDGDTTDDESREEQIARMEERKRAAVGSSHKDPSTPLPPKRPITKDSATPDTPQPSTPKTGRGPKTGNFALDPTRAAVTTDADGKKIKLLPPSQPLEKDRAFWKRAQTASNSRNNSPPNSSYLTIASPATDDIPDRPFTAKSTLGSMFNGNLDILRNNDVSGIADDLFPAIMRRSDTSFTTVATGDSDVERQDINMQDFVAIDDSESEEEESPSAPDSTPTESAMYSSFTSDGGHIDGHAPALLDHFDQCRGIVGSFRRNQHQAKHFSSLPSHPGKRASASEYNALQKGRRGAANTPMTPARKKRVSQDFTPNGAGIRKSMNSPLSARRPRSRGNSLAGITNADLFQTLTRNPFE